MSLIIGTILIVLGVFLYIETYYKCALIKHIERHKVKAEWVGHTITLKVKDAIETLLTMTENHGKLTDKELEAIVKDLEEKNKQVSYFIKKGNRHLKYCNLLLKFLNAGPLKGHLNFFSFFKLKRLVKKHCYEDDFFD